MSFDDNDPLATQLADNGYHPVQVASEFDSGGQVRRTFEVQGFRPILDSAGNMRDWVQARNLSTVTLTYRCGYFEEFTKIARKFADAITKRLVPTGGAAPLVKRTPGSLQIVFRDESRRWASLATADTLTPRLWPDGLAARDERSRCSPSLDLWAGNPDIDLAGGPDVWIGDRSPFTVPRSELSEWDGETTSIALAELVNEWAERGDLRICGRYVEPAPTSNVTYRERLDNPRNLDPMDPIRRIPGAIAKLFARRREAGLEGLDADQEQARLDGLRQSRTPGRFMPWLDN